jgi:hypothetical protein
MKNESSEQQMDVRSYFTEEVEDRIRSLGDKETLALLKELQGQSYWFAILRYNQERMRLAQEALITADPVKDPTAIARNQGILLGISDLQNAVISLNMQKETGEEEKL